VQSFADVHDTPDRSPSIDALGIGGSWIVQPLPFQRPANTAPNIVRELQALPTAVHARLDVQSTASVLT